MFTFGKKAPAPAPASTPSAPLNGMSDMSSLYGEFIGHRVSFSTTDGRLNVGGGIILHNVTHDGVVIIDECGDVHKRDKTIYIFRWDQLTRLDVKELPKPVENDTP